MLQKALSEAELMRHNVMQVSWTACVACSVHFVPVFTVFQCMFSSLVFLKPVALLVSPRQMQALKTKFRLDRGQTCDVCQKEFAEPQFCSLHGNMMHLDCAGS